MWRFISITPLSNDLGFGVCDYEEKNGGRILNSIIRFPWNKPDERVILYSLYKFAEKCGNNSRKILDTHCIEIKAKEYMDFIEKVFNEE